MCMLYKRCSLILIKSLPKVYSYTFVKILKIDFIILINLYTVINYCVLNVTVNVSACDYISCVWDRKI